MGRRIGSLFSGAGGLDLAVLEVFGGDVVWHAEIDKAASKVLAYRFPGVPNLGDISAVDWADVPAVDVLCGGFPCQDVSSAGRRAGIKAGTRSGLWAVFADAIDALRPQWVVIENVRGLLSATAHRTVDDADGDVESGAGAVGDGAGRPVLRAAGAVLGDLADLGYDAQWATVAAADVGAPHRRERVFIVAHSGGAAVGQPAGSAFAEEARQGSGDRSGDSRGERTVADGRQACGCGDRRIDHDWFANPDRFDDGGCRRCRCESFWPAPDSPRNGWDEGRPESAGLQRESDGHVELLPTPTAVQGRNETSGRSNPDSQHHAGTTLHDVVFKGEISSDGLLSTPQAGDSKGVPKDGYNTACLPRDIVLCNVSWGKYEPAIRRWESLTVAAPRPTEPGVSGKKRPRLNAQFSEWLMGWPPGWVTDPDIGISRNDQLRIVGNGVCPQQAAAALRYLLAIWEVTL